MSRDLMEIVDAIDASLDDGENDAALTAAPTIRLVEGAPAHRARRAEVVVRRTADGYRVGEGHHRTVYPDELIAEVQRHYREGVRGKGITSTARKFALPVDTVRDWVRGRTRIQ